MLVTVSKLPSSVLATYQCTLVSPSLLALNIHLTRCRASQGIRRKNNFATGCSQKSEHAGTRGSAVRGTLVEAASLAQSPERGKPQAWVALVDAFLPRSLRSTQKDGGDNPAENTTFLPELLFIARSTTPLELDILGYMAVSEGRWDAVRWLFRSMSREHQTVANLKEREKEERFVLWSVAEPNPYGATSLEEITKIPISFRANAVPSARVATFPEKIRLGFDSDIPRPKWLGQIWAMLAYMILNAADFPTNHANGRKIMSFVLETLAHLHHIDAVPRSIYTYRETSDANESYKPPTLSLMAYHIMSALSDSAWRAQDEEIRAEGEAMGARKWYKGHEMPEPTIQPRIDKLAKETWLDLVLWCCVEGGYYTEAAWVVAEILKRKSIQPWRVIGWSEICRPEEPKMNWSVRAELEIARSHLSQIGPGFGIAGPRDVPPLVDMGSRTVSREVVLALIDGLASSPRPIAEVEPQIAWCRSLLSQNRSLTLDTNFLNKVVLSFFVSRNEDTEEAPEIADSVFALTPMCDSSSDDYDDWPRSEILEESHNNEVPAAFLGLLHRTLYRHASKGNIQAALRTFRKIQKILDIDRQRHIIQFAEDLNCAERTGDEDQLISDSINNIIPSVYPQIPVHILAKFLDLLTDAHLYELGNWLLYSDEVDGPFIPRSLYTEPNLQSALLRFATATKNGRLFTQVSERLRMPLATNILRTILRCQITLGKWDAAEGVFRHFQQGAALGWRDTDIMFVARSVLRLEKDKESQPESLARARTLLQQLLKGEFNLPRDPSQVWPVSDWRRLSQIYLMLRTRPSILRNIREPKFMRVYRLNGPIKITSEAFNVLLEGIVETQGSLAGMELWRRWCRPEESRSRSDALPDAQVNWDELDKLVWPTVQTLRILTRPLIGQEKTMNTEEKLLVQWAVMRYRGFGLTDKEIEWELPGLYGSI